ncbi:hypothetical protein ACWIUD_06400 [Helicobacter sp. 23-1044]
MRFLNSGIFESFAESNNFAESRPKIHIKFAESTLDSAIVAESNAQIPSLRENATLLKVAFSWQSIIFD